MTNVEPSLFHTTRFFEWNGGCLPSRTQPVCLNGSFESPLPGQIQRDQADHCPSINSSSVAHDRGHHHGRYDWCEGQAVGRRIEELIDRMCHWNLILFFKSGITHMGALKISRAELKWACVYIEDWNWGGAELAYNMWIIYPIFES